MLVRTKQAWDQGVPTVMLWQAQCRDVIVHPACFDESHAPTSFKHTRGLVRTDNQLTPTDRVVWVTLQKSRPQLLRRTMSILRVCRRQFCAQQTEFQLASALFIQSGKPSALHEPAYNCSSQPGETLPPWGSLECLETLLVVTTGRGSTTGL